jgi:hypothetical protein
MVIGWVSDKSLQGSSVRQRDIFVGKDFANSGRVPERVGLSALKMARLLGSNFCLPSLSKFGHLHQVFAQLSQKAMQFSKRSTKLLFF